MRAGRYRSQRLTAVMRHVPKSLKVFDLDVAVATRLPSSASAVVAALLQDPFAATTLDVVLDPVIPALITPLSNATSAAGEGDVETLGGAIESLAAGLKSLVASIDVINIHVAVDPYDLTSTSKQRPDEQGTLIALTSRLLESLKVDWALTGVNILVHASSRTKSFYASAFLGSAA